MKTAINRFGNILAAILVLISFQGCAGSGMASSDNVREYPKSFNQMQKVVDRAIGATNIMIDDVLKSDGKVVLVISRKTFTNTSTTEQEHGKVIITKVGENKTSVEVHDPEYEFSVPDQQREHYKRNIFRQIDAILKKG